MSFFLGDKSAVKVRALEADLHDRSRPSPLALPRWGHGLPNAGGEFQLLELCSFLCSAFLFLSKTTQKNQQELHSINMEAGPSRSALGMGSAGLARLGHRGVAADGERLRWWFQFPRGPGSAGGFSGLLSSALTLVRLSRNWN